MRYNRVYVRSIGYELAPVVVTSSELEERLESLYETLHIQPGQLESLTGICERRWWEPNTPLSQGAINAAKDALVKGDIDISDIEVLVYSGVCRENFEPATACPVAHALGANSKTIVYDISNACLGVLNGMLDIANRIELGQIRAGLVVSCESAREINETMITKMLDEKSMDFFLKSLATLTGGSGAISVLLTDDSFTENIGHKLIGGMHRTAPEFHKLCRWGTERSSNGHMYPFMTTDSANVLKYGIQLFKSTWIDFLNEIQCNADDVDKIVCHQVGAEHQKQILNALEMPKEKDLSTFEYLGNIGTVSLPITAALSEERDILETGERVGFLGIGSGLNTLMLGLEW